ncbi:MAG: ribosomal RNA small subunit methyltransferase A [Flavobacteriales bacterium]|nr:MAG: ribosomal RNA small subunit methyltransferase A [Flavobacteriales bacterium]
MNVRPKKHLGQHFLTSQEIARRIAEIFKNDSPQRVLEIGPGTGVLTRHLCELYPHVEAIEIDGESVNYLHQYNILPPFNIHEGDFLRLDIRALVQEPTALIGNFPYNISTQIMFRLVELRDLFPQAGGMFQKEVAERIAAPPGSKVYGILSVWVQAFYKVEYAFTVAEGAFNPPPKVKSGVIYLTRLEKPRITGNPAEFLRLVKTAFGQRRKMLRRSLAGYSFSSEQKEMPIFERRPETLSVEEFDQLLGLLKYE